MPNIITNGLIGYWHYKQGVSGNVWNNIAPDKIGKYNGQINGSVLNSTGIKFDGIDDYVKISDMNGSFDNMTAEIWFKTNQSESFSYFFGIYYKESEFLAIGIEQGSPVVVMINDIGDLLAGLFTEDFAFNNGQYYHVSVILTNSNVSLYVNGNFIIKSEDFDVGSKTLTNFLYIGGVFLGGGMLPPLDGSVANVKLYNRALSEREIKENYYVGQDFVLSSGSAYPVPTVLSISKNKISPIAQMNESAIKFKFDKPVTRWEVRVLGGGQGSGTLADSGGAVAANTEITAIVDSTELYQEGQNRINIYGLGTDGSWTPYE